MVTIVDGYRDTLNIKLFDRLIDWGWFYFITKPMFHLIDFFYQLFGNFGVAILAVTVLVKAAFFPLANKSYKSMSAMKKLQPKIQELRELYKDDKVKQQQAQMELFKKEEVNPLAGCWPVAIQIPVFFSLYKVLFVTIEMRHAPFFGWIHDLSAKDPTNVFTLFGLIPWDPSMVPFFGGLLVLGAWPLIMGVTMFVQMKLNPTPPDPAQADDLHLDAGDLHLHAVVVPGRARHLLGVEQHAVGDPAVRHHAAAGRRRRPAGQHPRHLPTTAARAKPAPVARRPVEDDADEAEDAAPRKPAKPKKPAGRARPRKAGAKARG